MPKPNMEENIARAKIGKTFFINYVPLNKDLPIIGKTTISAEWLRHQILGCDDYCCLPRIGFRHYLGLYHMGRRTVHRLHLGFPTYIRICLNILEKSIKLALMAVNSEWRFAVKPIA